jgi:hypothetical protein
VSQPASKRQPEITLPSSLSQPSSYGCDKCPHHLAVQPVYRQYFRSEHHEDETMAGDRTLEACQLRFAKLCALIAVNEDIMAEGQLIYRDMPRLLYSGQFDLSQIPIITLATRTRFDVQNYWAAPEPKAIAIHPWGTFFIATGSGTSNEAQETVLTKCNNDFIRSKEDGPCFLYAINNEVVLSQRRTRTK